MKRRLYGNLLKWKNSKRRKPLLLQGARQVGKTYLINEFGKKEYSDFIYLNFEQNPNLSTLFSAELSPSTIIKNIGLYIGKKINYDNTLIFFDEIQVLPNALTSLKYFFEQAPDFHIISAGSLLGVSVAKQSSFPVGKVNFMTLYPMSFAEYLEAAGEDLLAYSLDDFQELKSLPEIIHEKLLEHLKNYLYIGGMPEAVQSYLDEKDIRLVRDIQTDILNAYQRDFSKYTEKIQTIKITELWNSIPYQLAKENKKFKYSDIRKKARASMYEQTIEWLKGAGLINVAYNISIPKLPLGGYADRKKFKLYLLDTGLLGAMLNLTSEIITSPADLFSEYNGAFIENYAAMELMSSGYGDLYYWTSNSDAEVDFVVQVENKLFPIEVKSGRSRNLQSLRSYAQKYKPELVIRTSPRNFTIDGDFMNIPLYAVSKTRGIIQHLKY